MKNTVWMRWICVGIALSLVSCCTHDLVQKHKKQKVESQDKQKTESQDKQKTESQDEQLINNDVISATSAIKDVDQISPEIQLSPEHFEDIYRRLENKEWVGYDDLTMYYASMEAFKSYKFSDPAINIKINSIINTEKQDNNILFMNGDESAQRLLIKEAESEWYRRLDEDVRYVGSFDDNGIINEPYLITMDQYGSEEYSPDVVFYNVVTHKLTDSDYEPIMNVSDTIGLDNLSFIDQYPALIYSNIGLFIRSEADKTDYEIILIDHDLPNDD